VIYTVTIVLLFFFSSTRPFLLSRAILRAYLYTVPAEGGMRAKRVYLLSAVDLFLLVWTALFLPLLLVLTLPSYSTTEMHRLFLSNHDH
jgi:hypothetical protein